MALDPQRRDDSGAADNVRLRPGTRIAAVTSRYHGELTRAMLASARETLREAGLEPGHLIEIEAPGAYELPILAQRLAQRDDVDAVLCLGLVLKGETDHDVHIAGAVAHALQTVALDSGKPVCFGVLTCRTLEQATARAKRRAEGGLDKGHEVARAAIETLAALASASRPSSAGNAAHGATRS